jgi:hypothetical protein
MVRDRGTLIIERRARNIVLRQGAAIIAGLFSGASGSSPINQVQVGFAMEGATVETTTLTPPPDASIPKEALVSLVTPANFQIVGDRPDAVQVLIASVFKPTVELKDVTEAGLLAGDKLYNQVVFEPVTLRPGQDVTFFWEIDFPFGH